MPKRNATTGAYISTSCRTLLLLGAIFQFYYVTAFILPTTTSVMPRATSLNAVEKEKRYDNTENSNNFKKKQTTIGALKKELLRNQEKYAGSTMEKQKKNGRRNKRTRQRTDNPKQRYVYASQRGGESKNDDGSQENDNGDDVERKSPNTNISTNKDSIHILEAKKTGLSNPANQHCDPLVETVEPEIVGQIRVEDDDTGNGASGSYAYLINKPAGWSILGGSISKKQKTTPKQPQSSPAPKKGPNNKGPSKNKAKNTIKKIKIKNENGKDEFIEFDEADVMALLSPEEREAMLEEQADSDSLFDLSAGTANKIDIPGWSDVKSMTAKEREEAGIEDEDYDPNDVPENFDEADILALLSPEERQEYDANKEEPNNDKSNDSIQQRYESMDEEGIDQSTVENLKRIKARLVKNKDDAASFSSYQRPSIVSWLKQKREDEGNPIRGGKFWTALAGATDVDDSGLVLICPKKNVANLFIDYAEYVAVVGNGNFLAFKSKKDTKPVPNDAFQVDMISRVRKGREGDVSQTVRFVISEHLSTCSNVINHAQAQFEDGIRGDPAANPFDRRAPRRLIHCNSMSVSSLLFDETAEAETAEIPDDIAILSDRLNNHKFQEGSFLGRQSLRDNPLTNSYREVNGAADGFPGWTVDRYSDWLFVQHDEKEPRGPLPSIHDGYTAGVYLLPSNQDRAAMGSKDKIRPLLIEGREAPEIVPILENGITYHVSLDRDLSTGIFLDQRPHRAWLSRYCNEDTHVLNCFAHCGAFTIAAAKAGASTVSLDLNKKWLDRIEPQLEANGIDFDERHDCIYGDCFEWLEKLSKRGEKYDVVILDPPSSSVGKKKKRWSVGRDMAELVQMAAPLVKKGGIMITSTNNASLSSLKFTTSCQSGLERAGVQSKLERIQPMSVDFPSIGSQPVKNLVWRVN